MYPMRQGSTTRVYFRQR